MKRPMNAMIKFGIGSTQSTRLIAPTNGVALDPGQFKHEAWPMSGLYELNGQNVQLEDRSSAAYIPTGQGRQVKISSPCVVPSL